MFQVPTLVMTDIKQPGTFLYPVTKFLQCFGSLPAQLLQINLMFQHLHILNNELKYLHIFVSSFLCKEFLRQTVTYFRDRFD